MNILVDIGNTNAKWRALFSDAKIASCEGVVASEKVGSLIGVWCERFKLDVKSDVSFVVASVKGDAFNLMFGRALEARLEVKPRFVSVERSCAGVVAAYRNLSQLGVDRWLGLIASHCSHPGYHKVIISAGSALTADYLTVSGKHLGGVIAPGVGMMRSALNMQTDRAKTQMQSVDTSWRLGESTAQCVNSGIASMCEGWVDQIIAQALHQFVDGKPTKVLVFGGDAPLICEMLNGKVQALLAVSLVESMVLQGLEIFLGLQKQK